jgi:hypothetical protein
MKISVARSCIIALHRMYIPGAANNLKDQLIRTMPALFKEQVKEQEITSDAKDITPKIDIENLVLSNIKAKDEKK